MYNHYADVAFIFKLVFCSSMCRNHIQFFVKLGFNPLSTTEPFELCLAHTATLSELHRLHNTEWENGCAWWIGNDV